jgi:hypothetical protein
MIKEHDALISSYKHTETDWCSGCLKNEFMDFSHMIFIIDEQRNRITQNKRKKNKQGLLDEPLL